MRTQFLVVLILGLLPVGKVFSEVATRPEESIKDPSLQEPQSKEGQSNENPQSNEKKNEEAKGDVEKKKSTETSSYTGEIFVIRNGARTEVFFRNHNQSYFIPKGNRHNALLKDLQKKSKLNQMVTLQFNTKTREISEVTEAATSLKASPEPQVPGSSAGKENSK